MSKFSDLGHRLYTGEVSYDFIARRRRWYALSAILMLLSLGSVALRGLDFGIEFEGGADFRAATTVNSQTVDDMREALEGTGIPDLDQATVNTIGSDQVRVQTRTLDATTEVPQVRAAIGRGTSGSQGYRSCSTIANSSPSRCRSTVSSRASVSGSPLGGSHMTPRRTASANQRSSASTRSSTAGSACFRCR